MHDPLPDNYALSLKRLEGLIRRLKQSPEILQEYDATIQKQISEGIVEVVPDPTTKGKGELHYLPHHAVIRRDKETTKLRVVYDASARYGGPSLNDCLHTGPKFNQNVFDILLKFRTYQIALTADIEKAFLMISIDKRDRDALRFLWFDDIQKKQPQIVTLRFARVVFGVSSSPFLLNATIRHHLEKFSSTYPSLVSSIVQSLYVDDLVCGANDEESAYELFEGAKKILGSGSFNLRKFTTNSVRLQRVIDKAENAPSNSPEKTPHNDLDETYAKATIRPNCYIRPGDQKVLGVCWNVPSDNLLFSFDCLAVLAAKMEPTKRNVVSVVSRFYDPIGLVTPITIRFKTFIQTLCETAGNWDQPLTGGTLSKWQSLVTELKDGQLITIPRYYFHDVTGEVISYELCGFCDASTRAYAAVIYLVIKTSTDRFVRFVTSKTRVAPTQAQSIPRLELLSALLLARLVRSVSNSLESQLTLNPPRCFTDSRVALYWIRGNNKEWKQFVQNRAIEIRKLVPPKHWSYCRSQDNPADIPSRGNSPRELTHNKLWWSGPDWLNLQEMNTTEESEMPAECVTEMKVSTHSLLTSNSSTVKLEQFISCENYSSLSKLLRVTAYVIRFIRLLKNKAKSSDTIRPNILEQEEIDEAGTLWIVQVQTSLAQETHFNEWKKQFGLFLDHKGIWRCGGRLDNADFQYATKHPIFLSKHHHLVALIVRSAHEKVSHNGVKDTLTQIRAKYWIVQGRSLVKSIIHRCVVCRRYEGRPYASPAPPPLPAFRVSEAVAFSSTGVDFAGPLYIKTYGLTKSKKVWICLYTCCITRAVSIDLVPDMSTETFICSLKRFCARRGMPRLFISDNGKTFVAAAKLIKKIIDGRDVQQHLSQINVKWSFNLAKAPWWGGVFERMVRSTKRCLRKVIGQAKLSYDELLTAITEVEAIINSRPLSYITPDDLDEPLTPSHLLMGRRILSLPDGLSHQVEIEDSEFQINPANLTRRVKHFNITLNQFWKRWRHEYLIELREAHRHANRTSTGTPIAVGDLVVVHSENQPRGFWKLAKVEETIIGRDGKIRGAILKVSSSNGKPVTLQRPLALLYPLEVNCQDQNTTEANPSENQTEESEDPTEQGLSEGVPREETTSGRPRREAASRAEERVKDWMAVLSDELT